jgi:sorbitol-specific phosphotransferase system component IIBC
MPYLIYKHKGNNKITELRTILQREVKTYILNKQTKSSITENVFIYHYCFISFQTEHVVHVLYAQDRQKVDEIRRGRAFAHIALMVILAFVVYTVLGLIINVKMLLPIAADMLKNRHF